LNRVLLVRGGETLVAEDRVSLFALLDEVRRRAPFDVVRHDGVPLVAAWARSNRIREEEGIPDEAPGVVVGLVLPGPPGTPPPTAAEIPSLPRSKVFRAAWAR
jgi:hypothetical protein